MSIRKSTAGRLKLALGALFSGIVDIAPQKCTLALCVLGISA
jgi:hypothetical protein